MIAYIDKFYPCDMDCMGECPKAVCDCKNCIPYEVEVEEKDPEESQRVLTFTRAIEKYIIYY